MRSPALRISITDRPAKLGRLELIVQVQGRPAWSVLVPKAHVAQVKRALAKVYGGDQPHE